MQYRTRGEKLSSILNKNLSVETQKWYHEKVSQIIEKKSAKDLYLFYSLLRREIPKDNILVNSLSKEDQEIIHLETINLLELSRIVVLIKILLADESFFSSKVSKLIEVADTSELEAFLKYLVYIPNPSTYRNVGVEALRTNIETIFCAIALNNPYPSTYFNDQQWNQMYLKAAFMQLDLSKIHDIDKRANRDLTRIISDYAHERWAASRKIDPYFWRPVSGFMEAIVLEDMRHLLQSEDKAENYAAALCCLYSESPDALELLDNYPEIKKEITSKSISWNNLKTVL